jgi:hypothetical protein
MMPETIKTRYCKLLIGPTQSGAATTDEAFDASSTEDDFLTEKVRFSEGISMIPFAEIEAYSGKSTKSYKELCELLDQPARLILRQTNGESRTIVGKVSHVAHLGICRDNPREAPIYHYRLTISSVLNDMRFVRQSRTFENQTFEAVIRSVLSYYSITPTFRCTTPDNADFYNKQRNFYQRSESDYDFFRRVLFDAGWSFRIYTKGDEELTAQEAILITDGNYFSEENDDTEFTASWNVEDQDQTINVKDWSMEQDVGIDSLVTDSSAFAANDGKRTWFLNATGSLFAADSNDDAKKEYEEHRTDNLDRFLTFNRQCCRGIASSLNLYPGCVINLSDFYGTSDEVIRSRITKMEINITDRMPEGYPVSGETPDLTIRIRGIDTSSEKLPLLADDTEPPKQEQNAIQAEKNSGAAVAAVSTAAGETAGAIRQTVFTATVSTKDGNTKDNHNSVCTMVTDENTKGMFFYAVLDGAMSAILVQFTMPLGGFGQGLYRLPRLGDRIVVMAVTENRYVLVNYIPSPDSMPFVDKDHVANSQKMTVLRHNVPGTVPSYYGTAADNPDPTIYKSLKYSEIGMYSENDREVMRLQTPGYRYDHAEKDSIATAANFLFSTPNNKDGEFHIGKVNKINLQADQQIRIQVGRSCITINEKMIEFRIRQTKAAGGPQDSVIYMNPMGIYLSSSRLSVIGQNRIDMEAGLGEVFSMSGGVVSLYGRYINMSTIDKNYLSLAMSLNAILAMLNAVSFGVGFADDFDIDDRTYDDAVKGGKINIGKLEAMESSKLDAFSQFFYVAGGMTSTVAMISNVFHQQFWARAPFFATGDNSSNIPGAVFSVLDAVLSGVLSGALMFFGLKTRTILCDALMFVFTEAKYLYLCARAQTIKLSKNEVSYMRMSGDLMEFWTKEMTVDSGKLTMNVFDIPIVPSQPDDLNLSYDERALLNELMGDPTRVVTELAKALAVGETLAATQVMKRTLAKVKVQMDSSSMSHTSPKWDAELDKVTFNSISKIDVTVGAQSKITIDSSGLTEKVAKLTQKLTTLEIKATKMTTTANCYTVKFTQSRMQGQMIQLG